MRSFFLLLVFCCTLLPEPAKAQSFPRIDSLLQARGTILSGRGGGYTVLLARNGKTIYERSEGAFSPDRAVPIASASKWYAGRLLMTLVHDRLLSLDDKVSRYLPSFRTPDKEQITLRQCFALTSGFPGSSETLDSFMQDRSSFAQMADRIAQMKLVARPGEELNYGGLAMQVAGRVGEVVTGKSWHVLFEERVVKPLGLRHTFYAGYQRNAVPRIAGGVISSASDYLKLLELLAQRGTFRGKQILTPAETAVLLSDQTAAARIGYSPFTKFKDDLQTEQDPRYGIGNWVVTWPGLQLNTSPGAFGFTPWIDQQRGYYGVLSVRSAFPRVLPVWAELLRLIGQTVPPARFQNGK